MELLSKALKLTILYDDLDRQFEMFLESIQKSIELCSSVQQWKKKQRKPPWFNNQFKNAINKKRQALKHFRRKQTASKKTRVLKNSQKTCHTVKEAK